MAGLLSECHFVSNSVYKMDVLIESIKFLLQQQNPGEKLKKMGKVIKDVFKLMPSRKHMNGRDMGRLEPTPSLTPKLCHC